MLSLIFRLLFGIFSNGEPGGTRTRDPLLKRQMLCQLSYRPMYLLLPYSDASPLRITPASFLTLSHAVLIAVAGRVGSSERARLDRGSTYHSG